MIAVLNAHGARLLARELREALFDAEYFERIAQAADNLDHAADMADAVSAPETLPAEGEPVEQHEGAPWTR